MAQAIAEDNLRLGRIVVADCVNPWPLTRMEWRAVGERAGVRVLDVEVVCSDVVGRDYRPWDVPRLVIDSALLSVDQSVRTIRAELSAKDGLPAA